MPHPHKVFIGEQRRQPAAGSTDGAGIGAGVAVGGTSGSVTLKLAKDLTPPIVDSTRLIPGGSPGTTPVIVKLPSLSVVVLDEGRIDRTPMVTSEIVRKARKLVPVTVTVVPLGPNVGAMLVVAAGTEWFTVLVEVVPDIVAVIVFVDGITAAVGTTKSTSNSPSVSGVTEVRLLEPYWIVTRKLFGEVTLVAGNPTPLSFTVVPIQLSESSMLIFRETRFTLAVAVAPPVSLATNCRLDAEKVLEFPSIINSATQLPPSSRSIG